MARSSSKKPLRVPKISAPLRSVFSNSHKMLYAGSALARSAIVFRFYSGQAPTGDDAPIAPNRLFAPVRTKFGLSPPLCNWSF
jgi:hypothetical protein